MSPMQQAQRPTRAAPVRGLRPPGKRPLPLHRKASAQTTRTPPRCPDVASIVRTLQGENQKAPARNAARALLDLPRPARLKAKPHQKHKYYRPTSPLSFARCVRSSRYVTTAMPTRIPGRGVPLGREVVRHKAREEGWHELRDLERLDS